MKLRRQHGDDKTAWLASHPWWGELSSEELAEIASLGDRLDLPADRLIMHRGQHGIEAALIIEGEVSVTRMGEVVAWLGPGEIVGELSILDGSPRNADVRTASDVQLLVLRAEELKQALETIEPLRNRVMQLASKHRGGTS